MPSTVTARAEPSTDPELLRGSLFTLRRKCGKPNCRCATGEPHESPALSYTSEGRTKILTLREEDLAGVTAALERYQAARDALDAKAATALQALKQHVIARREQARR